MHVGLPGAEQTRRVIRACQDDAVDTLVRDQMARDVPVVERGEDHELTGKPGLVEGRNKLRGAALGRRGRLENDGAARRQSSCDAAHRNGHGEIPRRRNDSDIHGHKTRPRHVRLIGELHRRIRVVMAEVDRFAHLGIGLIDGLASFGSGDLDELAPARGKNIANTMQCGCTLLGSQGLPVTCRLGAGLDEAVDRLVRGQRLLSGAHGLDTPRRGGDGRSDVACPLAVSSQSGIGIRFGGKWTTRALGKAPPLGTHPCLALGQTVLDTVGNGQRRVRINVGQRGEEAVALTGEDILVRGDVEDPGHEVLGCSPRGGAPGRKWRRRTHED